MIYLILSLGLVLQGVLSNYLPFYINNLSFLSINLPIISLIITYTILERKKQINLFYLICFIYGIIYDLLFTNTLILHSLLFIILGFLNNLIYKKLEDKFLNFLLIIIINIFLYDILLYLLLILFKEINFNILSLVYKLYNSIFLNIIYGITIYLLTYKYRNKLKTSIY